MYVKMNVITLGALMALLSISCSKEIKPDGGEQKKVTVTNPKAERDFQEIDTLKAYFCDYPEECEHYGKSTFLEKRRFEEKVYRNRVRLAQNFLDSYPDDPHYFEVLKFFFNLNFEPRFLVEDIPDSLATFLSKEIQYGTTEYYKRLRSVPIDTEAQRKWLDKGYGLAAEYLQSDAPLEKKLEIEIAVQARDFRLALEQYKGLEIRKNGIEKLYWEQFDKHYWEPFRLRMYNLVEKYSELEIMANHVAQFIGLVTSLSPNLAKPYWEGFLQMTDGSQSLGGSKGFKAIHKMAMENLKALDSFDDTKPLEMAITSMDGTRIDLADMRGKVVLLDFWSIRCPPCITEMPHIQAMYEKYREHGFEVVGLAADGDDEKTRVIDIITKQGATWPQYLDTGRNVTVSYHSLYQINSYPTVWLLNKDGLIVDRNARGSRLEPLIRKYLGLDP